MSEASGSFLHALGWEGGKRVLVARVGIGLAILGSALAVGTIHPIVLCIVAAFLAVVFGIGWGGAEPFRARRPATIVLAVGVFLAAFTALQAVPLPAAWLAKVAPASADVWSRALLPLREAGPSAATVSVDAVATRIQVLRGVVYLLTFLLAVRIAHRRQGGVFLECAVAFTGLALAVAALLHPAFGVDKVFGIYKHGPGIEPRHVAPLLNANHLAAYLNIAFCIALAYALAPRPEVPRVVSFTVVAVLLAVQLWVASRGGVLAMGASAVLVIALSRGRTSQRPLLSTGLPLLVLAGAGLGMGVLSASNDSFNELADADVSKLQTFRQAMRMMPDFGLLGAGRGTFQSVFPAYRMANGYNDYTHPENIVAQWCCEWGLPVALLAAALLLFALRPTVALQRSRAPVGAWAALAAVGVHNLVDFSSEVPGVVIACAVCAGVCVGGSAEATGRSRLELWGARPKIVALAGVVLAALAIAWVVPVIGKENDQDREDLRERALDKGETLADFHDAARAAMLRHPAEPYLPFAGAVRVSRARDEAIMPWLERTFERARVYGPAHLLLARAIASRSPSQARMEYRYAAEQDASLAGIAVNEALPLIHDFDDAMEVVPEGPAGLDALEALAEGLAVKLPATRVRIDEAILARDPAAWKALTRRVEDSVRDVEAGAGAPWCEADRLACVAEGDAAAKRLIVRASKKCDAYALRARLLIAAGQAPLGLDVLETATDQVDDREACLRTLATMAHDAHDPKHEGRALEKLEHGGCPTEDACIARWSWLAGEQEARGENGRALALYTKILEHQPDNEPALAAKARVASEIGMHAEALSAYKQLLARHPGDATYQRAMETERSLLFQP